MPSFRQIAEPLAKMGVPITPVRPGTKRAFLPDFPTTATTDLNQIYAWDKLYPDHNAACVARAEEGGIWFLETDSPDVSTRVLLATGYELKNINTFKVRSRPGRGHYYFRHNARSLAMGNISQAYVINQDWSVRTNREYVVAPGSIHPETGVPYHPMDMNAPIIEAPDWLIDWLLTQKITNQKKPSAPSVKPTDNEWTSAEKKLAAIPRNANGKMVHGTYHGAMLTVAGYWRAKGLEADEIEQKLTEYAEENFEPPIDWSKVKAMSVSICNFPAGEDKGLKLTQTQAVAQSTAPELAAGDEPEEEIDFTPTDYPKFPTWVMKGTSLYEGFAKPYSDVNERIDYFMWVPAAVLMMNYLGTKARVHMKSWMPSFFVVLIGKRGVGHKSSSIEDAMKYFEFAQTLAIHSREVKNADGRSLVFSPGSPEGLGTDMMKTNCKNVVLYYNELSTLVSKARIEGSGMSGAILNLYDSGGFSNSVKSKKDVYSVTPNSYCASLLTATTDQRFAELWAQLAGNDTGLKNRFSLIYQPEDLPEPKIQNVVSFHEGALVTRKLIDKAVNQGLYKIFDSTPLSILHKKHGNPRLAGRAEKWAFYFAVDLGLDEIDEECIDRGIAMAQYEIAVEDYLTTFEAKNDEANIQGNIVINLKKNMGRMSYRDLERALTSNRYGLTIWNRAVMQMVNSGYLRIEGKGVRGSKVEIVLLRDMEFGKS